MNHFGRPMSAPIDGYEICFLMAAVGQNDPRFDILVVYGPLYKNLKSYGTYIYFWELIGSALTIQACDCIRVKGQAFSF